MKCGAVIIENRNVDIQSIIDRHKKFLPDSWDVIHINDPSVVDAYTYNNLITSEAFWNNVPFDKVLVFQSDSWLLRFGIEEFLEWDYIGAPWQWQLSGGNGGLSLRTKSVMLDVIRKYPYNSTLGNEDVYFSNFVDLVGGKLATRTACRQFSMESVYHPNTLGIHSEKGKELYDMFHNTFADLSYAHKDQEAYIVGKGVSLQYLRKEHIGDGIVVTLNQAIIPVEQLGINNIVYSMQKDGCGVKGKHVCADGKPNDMTMPLRATLLVHSAESLDCLADYKPRYVFTNTDLGLRWDDPSIFSAIRIIKYMGCSKINIVSCDSLVNGSNECYVPGVGIHSWTYAVHSDRTFKELETIQYSLITPQAL